jgi:hypothetical protein
VEYGYPLAARFVDALDTFSESLGNDGQRIRRCTEDTVALMRRGNVQTLDDLTARIHAGVFDEPPRISGEVGARRTQRTCDAKVATHALFLSLEPEARKTGLRGGEHGLHTFQTKFMRQVVAPDGAYSGKIANLLGTVGVPPEKVVLSDLCPMSLVKRQGGPGQRTDDNRQPTGERAEAFHRYLEHEEVSGWTVRRLLASRASRIIALGWLAEHGLLRLFHSMEAEISCRDQPWEPVALDEGAAPWSWVYTDAREALLKAIVE